MDLTTAALLGLVQGLTEFLPISSSGHLAVLEHLLGVHAEYALTFPIVLHVATLLSIVVVFYRDLWELVVHWRRHLNYWVALLISALPAGIVGVLWHDEIEHVFAHNLWVVAGGFALTALLLFIAPKAEGERPLTPWRAFVMGLGQALALLPGVSRSGATITTGLLQKMDAAAVVRFAFLMSLIPIGGALLLEIWKGNLSAAASESPGALAVGFITAFVSGVLACRWMIRLVTLRRLWPFAVYCLFMAFLTAWLAMKTAL